MIDSYLQGSSEVEDHVIHLLFSANRWEAVSRIESAIAAETTVLIDRYYYSGIVYSAAKCNPSLSLQWARNPDVGLPRPDVCIFLNVSAEIAMQRGGYGGERYETQEMQDRVRKLFFQLRGEPEGDGLVVVDGGRSPDSVEAEIADVVARVYGEVDIEARPLRRFGV